MTKNLRVPLPAALWSILLILIAAWLAANTAWPQQLPAWSYASLRTLAMRATGIVGIGVMSVAMCLAARPKWLEPHLDGLDKMYRLHKWLGIAALVLSLVHWWAAQVSHWMADWGWLPPPVRAPETPVAPGTLESGLRALHDTATTLGQWPTFYIAALLMILALVKRFPYFWFAKTHQVLAIAYLALAFHAVVLIRFVYWRQPVGWMMALLLAAGTVSALLILAGRVGASRKARGQVVDLRHFGPIDTLRTTVSVPRGWPGHAAGQFAFVKSHAGEPPHPYTIASAWDAAKRELVFVTKALGDHTRDLPETLRPGQSVTVEGPYGRFTFDDDAPRQIWIGGGIGITPFIARMQQLALDRQAGKPVKPVHLFHSTREVDEEALALLARDAAAAGVPLTVLIDGRDGFLTGERIRADAPQWREASVWFCGPAGFGRALRANFAARGYPAKRFHQELFHMR